MSTYVVVDCETTGLDAGKETIVEVAAIRFDSRVSVFGEPVALASFSSLANPGRPTPPEVSGIHLIADRHVLEAPPAPLVRAKLAAFVGDAIVVAHNAPFDRSFLLELDGKAWVCSYRLARHLYPDAPNYKNGTLRFWLGLDDDDLARRASHRAHGDASVTARVFARELQDCAAIGVETLADVIVFEASPVPVTRFAYGRKHRAEAIDEIPAAYLAWVLEDAVKLEPFMHVDADTIAAIRAGLTTRGLAA